LPSERPRAEAPRWRRREMLVDASVQYARHGAEVGADSVRTNTGREVFQGVLSTPGWRPACLPNMSEAEMFRRSLVLAALVSLTTISASGGEQLKIAVSPAYS